MTTNQVNKQSKAHAKRNTRDLPKHHVHENRRFRELGHQLVLEIVSSTQVLEIVSATMTSLSGFFFIQLLPIYSSINHISTFRPFTFPYFLPGSLSFISLSNHMISCYFHLPQQISYFSFIFYC